MKTEQEIRAMLAAIVAEQAQLIEDIDAPGGGREWLRFLLSDKRVEEALLRKILGEEE